MMNNKPLEPVVPSFQVDHSKLKAGLYLRDKKRFGFMIGATIKVWDVRFYAPSSHEYMTPGAVHVIEHWMAYYLRKELGDGYVTFNPYGCETGFELVTAGYLDAVDVTNGLFNVLEDVVNEKTPLVSVDDVPSMNAMCCGNPVLYDIEGARKAMFDYYEVLRKCLY